MAEIHWAARRGDLEAVDAELAAGASMSELDQESSWKRWTPLAHAANSRRCDIEAFKGLIARAVAEGGLMATSGTSEALRQAAKKRDLAKVRALLEAGVDPAVRLFHGNVILDSLPYHRSTDGVACFMAILDALPCGEVDPKWLTVLVRQAAGRGNREAIAALARYGGKPLREQLQAEMGHVVAGIALGDGLATLEHSDLGDLQAALRMAASLDELAVVQALAAKGADVHGVHVLEWPAASNEMQDDEAVEASAARSTSPGMQAIADLLGNMQVIRDDIASKLRAVEDLVDEAEAVPARSSCSSQGEGDTLLVEAAEGDALRVAEWLLAEGLDPNHSGYAGWTPLWHAVSCGSVRVARLLIDAGAELVCDEGPLITEATATTVPLLLDAGADIDVIDESGYCALVGAAEAGDLELVKYLLDRGATVDNRDSSDQTALHRAVSFEETAIVELLLERGADPNIQDLDGYRALDYAHSKYMQQLIRDAGGEEGPRCW